MAGARSKRRSVGALALLLALVLVAAACGSSGSSSNNAADTGGTSAKKGTIKIGWIPWDEDVAATNLWKHVLEAKGYKVELTQLDVAPLYAGMAKGSIDLFLDGWLPTTHADYWKQYGPQLEDVHVWYDSATLNIAVPNYVNIDSLAQLKDHASEFGSKIVGIESGSGLMRITRTKVLPDYGLQSWNLLASSTPAMLAQLKKATDAHQPIVVTLWHPHWAYAKYPIKDLKDPKGALGTAEQIHVLAHKGFSQQFPDVAKWLKNFQMNDQQLGTLEDLVINQYQSGQEQQAVTKWLSTPANQQLVDGWTQ